jgi:small subunit ribosomal protein S8
MDPIADMITKLKNAGLAQRDSVTVSYSRMKERIAEVLKSEGYIKGFEKKSVKGHPALEISLIIENRIPKIKGVKRVSKPSKRIYTKSGEIRKVKYGYGSVVLSTPAGVLSGKEAKKQKVGGEALFEIW